MPPWEGRIISDIVGEGFVNEPKQQALEMTGLRVGQVLSRKTKELAIKELYKTGRFEVVETVLSPDPKDKGRLKVNIYVVEQRTLKKD